MESFIAWWVRNAAVIGPVANCVSAIAALLTVRMVFKTIRQTRKDRKEELLEKHPKFKIANARLERPIAISPRPPAVGLAYSLSIDLKNINPNPAYAVHIRGTIYRNGRNGRVAQFEFEPAGDLDKDEFVSLEAGLEIEVASEPYYLILKVEFRDSITSELYDSTHYRRFYINGGSPLSLEKAEKQDIRALGDILMPGRHAVDNSPREIR
jgi:hypothetical protein